MHAEHRHANGWVEAIEEDALYNDELVIEESFVRGEECEVD